MVTNLVTYSFDKHNHYVFRVLRLMNRNTIRLCITDRDGKSDKHASNACVNFFLARIKYVQNFFCFVVKVSYVAIFRFLG